MYIANTTAYKYQQNTSPVNQKGVLSGQSIEKKLIKGQSTGAAKEPSTGTSQGSSRSQVEQTVSLEVSKEGRALSKEREETEKFRAAWEAFREQKKKEQSPQNRMLSNSQSAGKKKKKSNNNALSKALMIARRIMRGDKVPPKDESFLFRYNSDLYLKAKIMAIQNKEAEKHKSLLDEDEGDTGISGSSSKTSSGGGSACGGASSSGSAEGGSDGSSGGDSDGTSGGE
ncbi:MAG: hypothetical protein NC293_13190 [Roseburia sp.]|nr:hypothetical protein [Roseburia sp.]